MIGAGKNIQKNLRSQAQKSFEIYACVAIMKVQTLKKT